ncbi:MAG: exodeoxyribonuclease V subunit gamma [Burkholderiaceae bacterium]|nr:exodeoxyribonuclease V subunit gamma [Burkholderiaceae bacterium]
MTSEAPRPGLVILQGNRLERLAEAVFAWQARQPLPPLQAETFLVQSHGMGEWVKIALAQQQGICAATRVELPARFFWRAWRAVLGRAAVPAALPLDELPLTWRLMQSLPGWAADDPVFAPVAGFLGRTHDPARRLQLAQRLADLFDQYQVYRPDWLDAWASGHDRLGSRPVPDDQRWQPALWRRLVAGLPPGTVEATRGRLQARFTAALARGGPFPGLPPRVVLFGSTHLPHGVLQMLEALAQQVQVLMAVPDPCRYHWADIVDGRELQRAARRRALRDGRDLATVPLAQMHAHGHPLLAAWGRQARDFVRALDAFEGADQRVELYDDAPATTMLARVQAAIRDLQPLAEADHTPPADDDRSIVFHVAHGPQREVEILHDQLLRLLAHPPGGTPLAPRDIVVMVPDIETFAPAIRAVFGQHGRGDARHIPWGLTDRPDRGHAPLLVALEWVLGLPQQRAGASELLGLLEVPAVARRFGLDAADLPTLAAWVDGAGIRWGLDAAQRDQLGLGAAGEANTAAFGLRRMLLGYAAGDGPAFGDIEPYAEVVGLEAGLAGTLAALLDVLGAWWREAARPATPEAWAARCRRLLPALFEAADDGDPALIAALDQALTHWLQATEAAGFDAELPLPVLREAWLGALDAPGGGQRFRAGGVTFCTLLPLRAIPFEVVCLLGMNDGDYPRRAPRNDFDLMALPGQARPGDRSRRDDDRQLMLDALLSARQVLYVSWTGRSVRDNQALPPSVLVAQLRDHLAAVWGNEVVEERTTEHPLQPFSRRYFEPGGDLFTYAREWRAAHEALPDEPPAAAAPRDEATARLTLADLAAFVRNPVQAWCRHRLQLQFPPQDAAAEDDEPFGDDGLERWGLGDAVLRAVQAGPGLDDPAEAVAAAVARLGRAGELPLAGPGRWAQDQWVQTLAPAVQAWQAATADRPLHETPWVVHLAPTDAPALDDALPGLRRGADGTDGPWTWVVLQATRLGDGSKALRGDKLVPAWLQALACAAAGVPATGIVIAPDVQVVLQAPPQDEAVQVLEALLRCWGAVMASDEPWPTAVRTGLAWLDDPGDPGTAAKVYDGGEQHRGEGEEPCLARLVPDFEMLQASPRFAAITEQLYEPLRHALATWVTWAPLGAEGAGDD